MVEDGMSQIYDQCRRAESLHCTRLKSGYYTLRKVWHLAGGMCFRFLLRQPKPPHTVGVMEHILLLLLAPRQADRMWEIYKRRQIKTGEA